MILQSLKKTPRFDSKGCAQEANDMFGAIFMEAPSNYMKEMLRKEM